MNKLSLDKQLFIFINEFIDKRVFVSIVFAIVSLIILIIGIYWSKIYESKSSILWTNYNPARTILQQRETRAESLIDIRDQIQLAKEIIFSNKNLEKLIQQTELGTDESDNKLNTRQLEVLKGNLRTDIQIYNTGTKIMVISYQHTNPEIAYLVVSIATEIFIQETRNAKNQTSQGAYDFINRQVQDYKFKLDNINKRIIEFRKANIDLDSDTRIGVNTRVNNLRSSIRETNLQLTEARVQKRSLESQLAEERQNIEEQLRAESMQASTEEVANANAERLQTLQSDLDTLRLSYTESYPDIIQIKEQIKNLKKLMQEGETNQTGSGTVGSAVQPDINFVESPLYISLAGEIADVETTIQTLIARVQETQMRLDSQLQRAGQVNAIESQLVEMTRDLDVTQTIYDDLLTRRENAKVSLNLQLENQGSTFKIQEPAVVPIVPVGLRLLDFILLSIPMGFLVPVGLIFTYLFIDPRIRHEDSLDEELLRLPVLGTVEHYSNEGDHIIERNKTRLSFSIVFMTFAMFGILIYLRLNQLIGA